VGTGALCVTAVDVKADADTGVSRSINDVTIATTFFNHFPSISITPVDVDLRAKQLSFGTSDSSSFVLAHHPQAYDNCIPVSS
jgi:hypothetical protein